MSSEDGALGVMDLMCDGDVVAQVVRVGAGQEVMDALTAWN